MESNPFWMVWTPAGHSPIFKHESERLANSEAQRLARKHPGREFYVLEAKRFFVKEDVKQVELIDPIPF